MGMSLSELEFLVTGPERASAVSRLASSSVFVGLVARGVVKSSSLLVNVDGMIFPIKVHRFLLDGVGVSVVSFGTGLVGGCFEVAGTELRLVIVAGDASIPSKPTNKLAAGN